ncbi:DMT family transporter [Dysosmobacter sp. Sow4_B12]|uniref:DMT family transporter n=1 Tax=Dysosmobacter sp. Sow4_B12 TaxID=3438777 RepID=UPI003F926B37
MKKALFCGILASLFFAFTFLLNHSMNLSGGYWMWSACLRYLIMLPILALVLRWMPGERFRPVLDAIRARPAAWLVWSTVGFGFFYLPLTLASVFGESWLVAASWQVTIVAGVLLTPVFGKPIPVKNLLLSLVILAGIALLQLPHLRGNDVQGNCMALVPILVAAFSYPLGNRKMMEVCPPELDAVQRVFGMTLCSLPFWLAVACAAYARSGAPSGGQLAQAGVVALFSGVIATILFFRATDLVRGDPRQLALIEATQCGEVIFTLLGGILVLGDSVPGPASMAGLALILAGMALNSLVTAQ